MNIGAHVSSSGKLIEALNRANTIGCETLQIFTSNPKGWSFKIRDEQEIDSFKEALTKTKIKSAYGHSIYLTNLASSNPYIYTNSINSLVSGLVFAERAGLRGVVTHIGSHVGQGTKAGLQKVKQALSEVLNITKEDNSVIFLETDAGSGSHLGSTFTEIGEIIKDVDSSRLLVCLDTCHIFAAGYDISNKDGLEKTLTEFEKEIGLKHLGVLHLNDSKSALGSKVDRHEEIGKGLIGLEGFRRIVNHPKLINLDGIVETPDNKDTTAVEKLSINTLKELRKC